MPYLENVRDTVRALRSHASLVLWVFGNELYPTDKSPPPAVRAGMEAALLELDGDASTTTTWRPYRVSSMTNGSFAGAYDWKLSMAPKDGPYGLLPAVQFSQRNPGMMMWRNKTLVRADDLHLAFQPEIGSVSIPVYDSLRRFLSPAALAEFPGSSSPSPGADWVYHTYLPIADAVVDVLGGRNATDAHEFSRAAQIVQKDQVQLLFESFTRGMWTWYTGVLHWKTQSPWPTLRGAMYDSDLFPNGGFYGARAALAIGAADGPRVFVQLDTDEARTAVVINRGNAAVTGARVAISAFRLSDGARIGGELLPPASSPALNVAASSVAGRGKEEMSWPWPLLWPSERDETLLVRAELVGVDGVSARTEYLRSGNTTNQTFSSVGELAVGSASLTVDVATSTSFSSSLSELLSVSVSNAGGGAVAVAVELSARRKKKEGKDEGQQQQQQLHGRKGNCLSREDDDRVSGLIFEDSFFNLLPGEVRDISVYGKRTIEGAEEWEIIARAINSQEAGAVFALA